MPPTNGSHASARRNWWPEHPMCGIAGIFRPTGLKPGDTDGVARMIDAQRHRGPSGSGVRTLDRAVLGHARLAIIDLSDAGAQPMTNEDHSLWLTYNGELYNTAELRTQLISAGHRFRSLSDTEVIIHGYEEWGLDELLRRVRGMFALALYDPRAGLLLARDRLGIKPLYFHQAPDRSIVFASEVRAVLASGVVPRERDTEAVAGFLLSGAVAAPQTIIRNVVSLRPGHYARLQLDGSMTDSAYWDLAPVTALNGSARTSSPSDRREAALEVRQVLEDSVTRHLVSDVPLGVFLSGGVDSGAVVAIGSRARARAGATPLTTLTVTFEEREFDEGNETREVARAFGTNHREIRVTRREFVEALPAFFESMDQPTNDGINTFFVARAAREAGLTVVLSGLGGDELFWGYGHYSWLARRGPWLAGCPAPIRRALSAVGAAWGRARGRDNWMRMEFLRPGASSRELYLLLRGFFPPRQIMDLLGIGSAEFAAAVERQFDGFESNFNYIEFKRYLHDQLLRDTDVFSMAHSIEVRVPFLDHPLVECAMSVEPRLKIADGMNKPLLVEAVDEPLITRAATARKRGFSFPMDRWVRETADQLEAMAVNETLLDASAVRARWTDFRQSRLHWSRAWALSVLGAGAQ